MPGGFLILKAGSLCGAHQAKIRAVENPQAGQKWKRNMAKILLVLAGACWGLLGFAPAARAEYMSTLLAFNQTNDFEDVSRTAFVDVNNNGKMDAGDVFFGFVQFNATS